MTTNPARIANPDDLVFYVKYHIKPEYVEEFQERLFELVDNMTQEPTFVSAFVHEDTEDSTRFSMYERWTEASKEDFMNYQMAAKDYRKVYEKRLPEISASPRKIHILRPMAFWASAQFETVANDLTFYSNFQVKPGTQADWKMAAMKVFDRMVKEDPFICAFLHQDAEDPTRFTIYERWNKTDQMDFTGEHRKLYEGILSDSVQSLRSFHILQPRGNWADE
ncbi:putative quinol monooxygenase [Ancylomarina sp.]|uniref:putative quinol monooxygenase n=1 Tax=Ancylomarina sp. TaxID=1970196 RepID=UPI003566B280